MTAEEAREYGLVDEVVKYRKELKSPPEKISDSKE
jgi:ATP-dependent protease ClpP protease subunit